MIAQNLRRVKEKIRSLVQNPDEITLVAVSKGVSVEKIKEAIEAGITDIGENRVQDAKDKFLQLNTENYILKKQLKFHLVGHLQSNKAKEAVQLFDLIHSVDSLHLARELNKQAAKIGKVQDILIQVNTSGEATKFGIKPDQASELIKEITQLKNLSIKGLMTIAPLTDNPETARPYFRALREFKDQLNELRVPSPELRVLSMGMTDDYEAALKEGANMIRLGRAIFETQMNIDEKVQHIRLSGNQ